MVGRSDQGPSPLQHQARTGSVRPGRWDGLLQGLPSQDQGRQQQQWGPGLPGPTLAAAGWTAAGSAAAGSLRPLPPPLGGSGSEVTTWPSPTGPVGRYEASRDAQAAPIHVCGPKLAGAGPGLERGPLLARRDPRSVRRIGKKEERKEEAKVKSARYHHGHQVALGRGQGYGASTAVRPPLPPNAGSGHLALEPDKHPPDQFGAAAGAASRGC